MTPDQSEHASRANQTEAAAAPRPRRDWLSFSFTTCTGLAVCALAAVAGFVASHGFARGLDWGNPVQAGAGWALLILLTAAGFLAITKELVGRRSA